MTPTAPHVVWWFRDAKPGHENQARGLIQALERHAALEVHELSPAPGRRALGLWLRGRFPAAAELPDPALIIGAGHATHLSLLAARRARGGRAVVLMTPSLPRRLFDLCLIPAHDLPSPADNVLVTRGPLNPMRPASMKRPEGALILVGGPSDHYDWDDAAVIGQIGEILSVEAGRRWTLTTSRRTPADFLPALRRELGAAVDDGRLILVPHTETGPDWLAGALASAPVAWVTEDSVSMVYEALTADCATGLLRVPRRGASRVALALDALTGEGLATNFDDWRTGVPLRPPRRRFDEAARCAAWIHDRWLAGAP